MSGGEPIDWPDDGVILYDGVCIFCARWVRFVAIRDTAHRLRFTPIESPYGRRLAERLGIDPANPDTNAVILGGRAFFRSEAALAVLSTLPGWDWVRLLRLVPLRVRDVLYGLIARNRYRVFGRRDSCDVSAPWLAGRVIWDQPSDPD